MRQIITLLTRLRSIHPATLAIGIIASVATYYFATCSIEASLIDGRYHPWKYDSFYVAAIVRDLVDNYPMLMQFDDRLQPLDGSAAISFTWAYTLLMATLVVLTQFFVASLPTATILAFIPPLWGMINSLLFIAICRKIGLGILATALGAAGFALAPYIRDLHMIGNIDHHFMELTFILLIMFSFLNWIERPGCRRRAAFAGAVLGISVAFHVAMFVFYIPIALFFLVCWIGDRMELRKTVSAFSLAVLVATLVAVLPSAHFLSFKFNYFQISWFHLYWAVMFCGAVYYLHRRQYSPINLAILVGLLSIVSIPAIDNWRHGANFITASLPGFSQLNETYSIFTYLFSGEYQLVNAVYIYYSGLLYALPFALILLARQVRLTPRPVLLYTLCACAFGAIFLFLQLRFKYHAPYVLLLPVLLMYQQYASESRHSQALIIVFFIICYVGPVANLATEQQPGGEPGYKGLLPFYDLIVAQCEQHPGVLLAHPDEGHFLRYHTKCKIVSNNMLATAKDFEYRALGQKMLAMSVPDLIAQYDWVDYIYVRLEGAGDKRMTEADFRALNKGIRGELLLDKLTFPGTKILATSTAQGRGYQYLLQTHNRW
jgi:hypothetical protein